MDAEDLTPHLRTLLVVTWDLYTMLYEHDSPVDAEMSYDTSPLWLYQSTCVIPASIDFAFLTAVQKI